MNRPKNSFEPNKDPKRAHYGPKKTKNTQN